VCGLDADVPVLDALALPSRAVDDLGEALCCLGGRMLRGVAIGETFQRNEENDLAHDDED
jgi:hypothetical protein